MSFSKRINTIIDMLKPGNVLADIGCDHAYVAIGVMQQQKFKKVIAADLLPGPLAKASQTVQDSGFADMIELKLSNGFSSIEEPFDAADICGMGGLLIRNILSRDSDKLTSVNQLVLGPHSELPELRKYLYQMKGFRIVHETVVQDAGLFYVLFDVRKSMQPSAMPPDEIIEFGDPSVHTDLSALKEYLEFQLFQSERILKQLSGCLNERSILTANTIAKKKQALIRLISDLHAVM